MKKSQLKTREFSFEEEGFSDVSYDPSIIVKHSKNLYKKANLLISNYILGYGFIAGLIAHFFAKNENAYTPSIMSAIIAGCIGYSVGSEKALSMKLQAQTALCQLEIEKNTRQNMNEPNDRGSRKIPPLSS